MGHFDRTGRRSYSFTGVLAFIELAYGSHMAHKVCKSGKVRKVIESINGEGRNPKGRGAF